MGSIKVNTENSSVEKSFVTATPSGLPWISTENRTKEQIIQSGMLINEDIAEMSQNKT